MIQVRFSILHGMKTHLTSIFCFLNINLMRNRFPDLQKVIKGNVDVASIAETKTDASFPSAQSVLDG